MKYSSYFVEENGIDLTNSSDKNTSYITELMLKCKSDKKNIVFGSGIFLFDEIKWLPEVSIIGAGWRNTIIKSNTANPLIDFTVNRLSEAVPVQPAGIIKGLTLDGNNIGTIGMDLSLLAFFEFRELYVQNFTKMAVNCEGVLIGQWNKCFFTNNPYHIKASKTTHYQSNLVSYNYCVFSDCSEYAVKYSDAASIEFNRCDFERCGTKSKEDSGAIYLENMAPNKEGVSTILRGCWLEANNGTVIHGNAKLIDTRDCRNVIDSTIVQFNPDCRYGLKGVAEISNSTIEKIYAIHTDDTNTITHTHKKNTMKTKILGANPELTIIGIIVAALLLINFYFIHVPLWVFIVLIPIAARFFGNPILSFLQKHDASINHDPVIETLPVVQAPAGEETLAQQLQRIKDENALLAKKKMDQEANAELLAQLQKEKLINEDLKKNLVV